MSENKTGNQYRATKIWHEIIESFQTNVPLKRHWRNFRTYNDCFAANEAIDWLFRYLKTSHNFKSQTLITRQQAIQLLQIFLKEKIIEDVRGDKYNTKEFTDDDRLYKFCSSEKYGIQYHKQANNQNIDPIQKKTAAATTTTTTVIASSSSSTTTTSTQNGVLKQQQHQNEHAVQIQQQQHQQTRRLSLTTRVLKEKNHQDTTIISNNQTVTKTSTTTGAAAKITPIDDYDLINYDKYYPKTHHHHHHHHQVKPAASATIKPQDLDEAWSMVALNHLYEILKFDTSSSTQTLLENIQLSPANIKYNCTHVNKHGVVTNASNNKNDDLPAWVMQAMTSLVHWTDFKKDHNNEASSAAAAMATITIKPGHPSFRDVFNEVNQYFLDHKEPLLTKQLSKLFIQVLRIFIQNTKQLEIEEFMRNLKEQLNTQAASMHHDFNYIDHDMIDGGCGEAGHDACCTQCLSTYDFVNNWLNCNEIEFNEFVMNLNANYRLTAAGNQVDEDEDDDDDNDDGDNNNEDSIELIDSEPEQKKTKSNVGNITNIDQSNTILATTNEFERKLRRNNSFIAAITDNNTTSSSSTSNCNTTVPSLLVKTHSLDQISKKAFIKDDLSATIRKPVHVNNIALPKRTPSFNDTQKIRNMLVNSISLNNIATQIPTKLTKMSVGALSSLISSVSLKDMNNGNDSFTLGFDYETFKQIIKAFRVCSLCLPPIYKRKLHLLLRLLYKLKFSEHSKLLIVNEFDQEFDNLEYETEFDHLNVESIIINSFMRSIISFDECDESIAVKIVQILINNYSEVMRIPDDFISNVQENLNAKTANFCSKISMEQYETEKSESRPHLIKLLYGILTNDNFNQEEKLKRLKQFKEIYPDIYEEKYANIKKAINILGINETSKNRYQLAKKRTLNSTTVHVDENSNSGSKFQINSVLKSNKNLDTTNIITTNTTTIASNATASINFPKFLLPKTLKKVRL